MSQLIEGNWDDLLSRQDLCGRRVRIVVLDEQDNNPWIKSLRDWADSHPPVHHPVDDSRDSIYSGAVDDSRS